MIQTSSQSAAQRLISFPRTSRRMIDSAIGSEANICARVDESIRNALLYPVLIPYAGFDLMNSTRGEPELRIFLRSAAAFGGSISQADRPKLARGKLKLL